MEIMTSCNKRGEPFKKIFLKKNKYATEMQGRKKNDFKV